MDSLQVFSWIERHTAAVLAGVLAVTGLLLVPYLLLESDTQATTDPPGDVFDALDLIDERLAPPLFTPFFVVEARDGDLLLRAPLLELLENEQAMRAAPEVAGKLFTYESADYGATVVGLYTIADAVDKYLRENDVEGGLEGATDEQVKLAVNALLAEGAPAADLGDGFSQLSSAETRVVDGAEISWRDCARDVIRRAGGQ